MTRSGTKRIGGLILAIASITALAACTGSATHAPVQPGAVTQPGSIGEIPAAGTPSGTVGSITYALLPGTVPDWILPMPTASSNTAYNVFNFEWQMWPPLYYAPHGSTATIDTALSVANAPVWSNGDKTMSITLKHWRWSDGQPLSAKDLLFTFEMIQAAVRASPANWAPFVPGFFPQTIVSMSTPNASTVVVNMSKAVNPSWMEEDILGSVPVMPSAKWSKTAAHGSIVDASNPVIAAKVFAFLTAQAKSVSTYATNPLWQTVDGPYQLSSFNHATGAFTMVPNTRYSGPHAIPESNYVGVPFTSGASEWNAIRTGTVDIGYVPHQDAAQIPQLTGLGYDYYGMPDFGDYFMAYNYKDTTGHFNAIASQLYFRQAMQHLEDQAGQIKAYFNGDGKPAYGPIPAYPKSPFLPSDAATNPYPFSTSDAISLLKANGWNVVPYGTDTCAKPGTGSGECGAGIPGGTKLAFNLIYNITPPIPQEVDDLAADARAAGIEIAVSVSSFNTMIQNYNDSASPANENQWAMEDLGRQAIPTYPTQLGLLNTGGAGQIGDWSNPQSDALINASVTGADPAAVSAEASYFMTNVPVLWQPVLDNTWAWKSNISATDPAAFENLTQFDNTPQFWYLTR
jgi:peptide/nickel transport system substrate-binding protein